jgi:hypothetical protein
MERTNLTSDLHQTPYAEGNPYTTDTVLPSLLKQLAQTNSNGDSSAFTEISQDLELFGSVVLTSKFLSF